jgi:hypothetical protein
VPSVLRLCELQQRADSIKQDYARLPDNQAKRTRLLFHVEKSGGSFPTLCAFQTQEAIEGRRIGTRVKSMRKGVQEKNDEPILSESEQRKAVLGYFNHHLSCLGDSYTNGALLKLKVNDVSTGATFELVFSVQKDSIAGEYNTDLIDIDPVSERDMSSKKLNAIEYT